MISHFGVQSVKRLSLPFDNLKWHTSVACLFIYLFLFCLVLFCFCFRYPALAVVLLCVRLSEQGMQIHISQTTKDHLEHEPYIIEERGKIFVKVRQ